MVVFYFFSFLFYLGRTPICVCILMHCPLLATKEITTALIWTSAAFVIVTLWFTLYTSSVKMQPRSSDF